MVTVYVCPNCNTEVEVDFLGDVGECGNCGMAVGQDNAGKIEERG